MTRATFPILGLMLLAGCTAAPHTLTISNDPVVVTTPASLTMAGGRAYWVHDSLVIELRAIGTSCVAPTPSDGTVLVSITIPRATAAAGTEAPVQSNILSADDVDVGVTEFASGSSHAWLLGMGTLRVDAVDGTHVVGGVVAVGGGDEPTVNGTFNVPVCASP